MENNLTPPAPVDKNMFTAGEAALEGIDRLPRSIEEAREIAYKSDFIKNILPQSVIDSYCGK